MLSFEDNSLRSMIHSAALFITGGYCFLGVIPHGRLRPILLKLGTHTNTHGSGEKRRHPAHHRLKERVLDALIERLIAVRHEARVLLLVRVLDGTVRPSGVPLLLEPALM